MTPLAWVTGAGGLIGNQIVQAAPQFARGWRVRGFKRGELDFCDFPAVEAAFRADPPRLIIHCAAISRSTVCQADPALARRVNVAVTQHLADLAASTRLIFFSSDLVFDGRIGFYREEAPVNPLSVYGETKALAEQAVLRHPQHTVIRTSLNGGISPTGDRGFNEQLRLSWAKGDSTALFTDEFRSPIPASLTARAVWAMVNLDLRGIVHLAGRERLSRWQIGELVAARSRTIAPRLTPASIADFAGPPRPGDTTLDCTRLAAKLTFPLLGLREWLEAFPNEEF